MIFSLLHLEGRKWDVNAQSWSILDEIYSIRTEGWEFHSFRRMSLVMMDI